ncbi:hypothetical protein C1O66_21205 [Paucibacter aquatile]|uniref:Uncharacterized protein n=1 Tax=Kinneretia aquatilis TaxID=2070761 RepID=A0A2N8KS19_9BURK|nr:hypothetical protein [Paucibacter aquatile]PND36230.1 hypothetical protein C1O66_21205 [Paucibacter aquatile]
MSYQFSGFLVAMPLRRPVELPAGAVWREISLPFRGIGVLLPHTIGEILKADQIADFARYLGIANGAPWLFMQYDTWGGEIDFVFGMGATSAGAFGPVEESARGQVEAVYLDLMARLGVGADDALAFKPFERGYWGEQ